MKRSRRTPEAWKRLFGSERIPKSASAGGALPCKKHPVVKELRHSKVDLPKPDGGQTDWKRTAHRPAADALAAALHHEQEEHLHKLGCQTKALHEYDVALQVEAKELGKDHPKVTSLIEKVVLEKLSDDSKNRLNNGKCSTIKNTTSSFIDER